MGASAVGDPVPRDGRVARQTERRRHPVVLRHLRVLRAVDLGPSMRRVTLTGPELDGFTSPGFDDHVKMFFPAPGEREPVLPSLGPDGLVFPEAGPRPIARDMTPRRHDPVSRELDVDFALRHEGSASGWAAQVVPGDPAWVAGPRGSFLVPLDFDWHLLVADETGLPALARRLEELPAGARAVAIVEVDAAADEIALARPTGAEVVWVHRGGAGQASGGHDPWGRDPGGPGAGEPAVLAALRGAALPEGDGFAWIAAESGLAKQLRGVLVEERGLDRRRVRAHGYWRRGAVAVHDDHDAA